MPIPVNTRFNATPIDSTATVHPPANTSARSPSQPSPPPAQGDARPPARPGAGQGGALASRLRQQHAASSSATPASSHGEKSVLAERMAREMLNEIPVGKLSSEFQPWLLDAVHSLSYERDGQYDTLAGKLTPDYLMLMLRNRHNIQPAQKREGFTAAPAGLAMRAFDEQQVANVESYGASFHGVKVPALLGGDGRTVGKTFFRDAAGIHADLDKLCSEVKTMLRQNKGSKDPMVAARIAAHFKQNYIAIHPYMDGNGRVSRLVAERIFAEFGLPAPDWKSASFDLDISIDETARRMLGPTSEPPAGHG